MKPSKIIIISTFITLLSFLYKLTLAYLTFSVILLIASISTLMVFICKLLFIKFSTKNRNKKKKAYLFMAFSVIIYSTIFILFVVLKINGIDISNDKTYEGLYGSLFILFIFIMFILSLLGLKKSLDKTNLMTIGLKEMSFISALADTIIIEEFVSRIILQYKKIAILEYINTYYSLGIGIIMALVAFIMLIRFIRYKS